MKHGKRKKKKNTPEQVAISKHEDIALKVTAQFFQDEIMPALNIEGEVEEILSTESIHLDLKKAYEDFNFLMKDGTIKHFEFQSTNEGVEGLKRFRMYEAILSYQHKVAVTTYVLFSGNIRNPMTKFSEGMNTYQVHPIIMRDRNADEVIGQLQCRLDAGETLTRADFLPLVLCPLMCGQMSQKERLTAAYSITRAAKNADVEAVRKVEAVLYIMADKFLDSSEMEQLKEEIKMTRLGQMLYNDGIAVGEERGELKLCKLITILLKENMTQDIAIVTSDEKVREQYYIKYGIQ